jgi:hypothetical protein
MHIDYNTPNAKLASELTGKTVRYLANKSKVTESGVRVFKIEAVEHIGFAEKTGKRFVTVLAKDIDDSGVAKYRNLQLAGIDLAV